MCEFGRGRRRRLGGGGCRLKDGAFTGNGDGGQRTISRSGSRACGGSGGRNRPRYSMQVLQYL